jgi:hypothetical protein
MFPGNRKQGPLCHVPVRRLVKHLKGEFIKQGHGIGMIALLLGKSLSRSSRRNTIARLLLQDCPSWDSEMLEFAVNRVNAKWHYGPWASWREYGFIFIELYIFSRALGVVHGFAQ